MIPAIASCNLSVIDLNGIMEQADHDEEFMRELLFDFRSEIHAQLLKMSQMLQLLQNELSASDLGRLQRAAQSIKDASLDMFCSEIHAAATTMEINAKKGNLKGCLWDYEVLERASRDVLHVLESMGM